VEYKVKEWFAKKEGLIGCMTAKGTTFTDNMIIKETEKALQVFDALIDNEYGRKSTYWVPKSCVEVM
jgi:hypothetical protein